MKKIKVKAPAKINYTLEILDKRPDGYHNLKSIMQTVNLYDYLTIEIGLSAQNNIILNSINFEIPLDSSNTVYKAIERYLKKANLEGYSVNVEIEKNIPSQAGMGGGSSDAAAAILAMNTVFKSLSEQETDEICASIGSDVNFCFKGGAGLCTSRGETVKPINFIERDISIIKPKNFGVSTKEAYAAFACSKDKTVPNNTEKLEKLMNNGQFDDSLLYNSFEKVLFEKCPELSEVKTLFPSSLMTGSGAAFFILSDNLGSDDFDTEKYFVSEGLKTIPTGAEVIYYEE